MATTLPQFLPQLRVSAAACRHAVVTVKLPQQLLQVNTQNIPVVVAN